jgi:hypothetical protein
MRTGATFDDLREACRTLNRAGRHEAALAAAEEAWRRFPDRRPYTWYLVAYANLRLGRAADAVAAIERAEADNHLWRIGLLRALVDEHPGARALLAGPLERLQARIAAREFQPEVLIATPDPPRDRPTLLLGLHGATAMAGPYHERWLPAGRHGCVVASAQSSQPATETTFCWDDRAQVRRDLSALLPRLPAHGQVVLTGFSQGGQVALELALAGDVVRARAVVAICPSFPPDGRFAEAAGPLSVVVLHGEDDPWASGVPATADALRAGGHDVTVQSVVGLGHEFPADFAERLGGLLATAGVRAS